jgi:N-formylglutamate amidohydrolase
MQCPDVCIGLNSPNDGVTNMVAGLCDGYGYSHALNTPFEGSIIPAGMGGDSLFSVMLDFNKRIYIKGSGSECIEKRFQKLQGFCSDFVEGLCRVF